MKKIILIICIGIGWGSLAASAHAASLSTSMSDTTPTVGQTVTMTVRLSSSSQVINAAEASVIFPPSILSLKSVSHSGSIFSFWTTEPSGSDASGRLSFSGGVPNPGYKGSGGLIFTATFTAKAVGTATISITGGKVLANDGFGTDIYTGGSGATIKVSAAASPSATPTTPAVPGKPSPVSSIPAFSKPSTWYPNTTTTVTFSHGGNYLGTSYVLDQNPNTIPGENVQSTSGTASITLSADGVWYLHARNKYASGWSGTTTVAIRRDTTPPEPFTLDVNRDRGEADPTPTISFSAKDVTSGIAAYTISIDGQAATPTNSPVTLPSLTAGSHEVVIVATDQAGNSRTAKVTVVVTGYSAPTIEAVSSPMVLLDTLTVRGQALNGDTITIFMDGNVLGQAIAGQVDAKSTGTKISVPWFFSTEQLIRPGRHTITATAKNESGQSSVATDPHTLIVTGSSIRIGGHPIATIALAPIGAAVVILIIVTNGLILGKLWWSFRGLYRREEEAEEELEALRQRMAHGPVTADAVEREIYTIESRLAGVTPNQSPPRRRRRKRGST